MKKMYGWYYLIRFNDLKPKLGRSINSVVPTLVSKERALGVSTVGQTLTRKALGDPLDFNYPEEGVVTIISPIAILKKAPHPNAAKLFMNFLNSEEYGKIVAKYYEQPLHSKVKIEGIKPLGEIETYILTPAEIQSNIIQIKRDWRDLFGA